MKRREFISIVGGAGAAWPMVAWAQQERMRRVAVLAPFDNNDPEAQRLLGAFKQRR